MSPSPKKKSIAWSLWIPVVIAFLFVTCAWTLLIKIARENPVETAQMEEKP